MANYTLQTKPFVVPTPDDKRIEEHFGQATNGDDHISIAHMVAPPGWSEPPQKPSFAEYVFVIRGKKHFLIADEEVVLSAGQSIKIHPNVRVQYSNPFPEECEYSAICTPAFTFAEANRAAD